MNIDWSENFTIILRRFARILFWNEEVRHNSTIFPIQMKITNRFNEIFFYKIRIKICIINLLESDIFIFETLAVDFNSW